MEYAQKERKEKAERLPLPRFWESLLALGGGRTMLHTKMAVSERPYIGAYLGGGLSLNYVVSRHVSRVELFLSRPDSEINKKMFDELLAQKEKIEIAFGESLSWQRLDGKQSCRIAYQMTVGGYKDDETNWKTIQTAMIDAMVRLEKSLSSYIPQLVQMR